MSSSHDQDLNRPVQHFMQPVESILRDHLTVSQAVESLRGRTFQNWVLYLYVVDDQDRLIGVLPTRKLLLALPDTPLRSMLDGPILSLSPDTSLREAMSMFSAHRLLALPVLDAEGRLLGAVDVKLYADHATGTGQADAQADLFQLIGLRIEEAKHKSPLMGVRLRMPWLACNMVGGLACAGIAALFEDVLAQVLIIAMFIPLVLTLSESISMQSMTMTLQLIHGPNVPWYRVRRRILKEVPTAATLSVLCGGVIAAACLIWDAGPAAISVIAGSIAISMIVSSGYGIGVPVSLHALRLDPRIAAGPVVLMLTDVTTTLVYLGVATWLLIPGG